jgi:hypothetical protein
LEIDLLRQGVDLLDLYRGRLSPRRLWLLIRNLPIDSALLRRTRPELAQHAWTPDGYVTADLIDVTIALQTGKFQKPYPRPAQRITDAVEQRDRFSALEEQAARNRLREGQETV